MRQLYVSQVCCKLKKTIPCTPPGIPGSCRCHKFLVLSIGQTTAYKAGKVCKHLRTLPQPSTVAHQNIMHSQWVQKTEKQTLRFFNTAIHQYGSVVLVRSSVALFAGWRAGCNRAHWRWCITWHLEEYWVGKRRHQPDGASGKEEQNDWKPVFHRQTCVTLLLLKHFENSKNSNGYAFPAVTHTTAASQLIFQPLGGFRGPLREQKKQGKPRTWKKQSRIRQRMQCEKLTTAYAAVRVCKLLVWPSHKISFTSALARTEHFWRMFPLEHSLDTT